MPSSQSEDKEHPTSSYLANEQWKTDTDTNKLSPMLPPSLHGEEKQFWKKWQYWKDILAPDNHSEEAAIESNLPNSPRKKWVKAPVPKDHIWVIDFIYIKCPEQTELKRQ